MIQQVNPWLDDNELQKIKSCLDRNWITEGPYCEEAREKLIDLLGTKYVTFAPNGTLGLFLALVALDLPTNSEVLVPDFTFFGSCSAIVMAGLRPVTVDVDLETYQMDVEDMKSKLSDNTSAIMPVHVYGQGSNICEIIDFAYDNNLRVIEDAAQVLGVKYSSNIAQSCGLIDCCSNKKKHLGTFGDIGVFSLYADKTITAGEGGIICCKDEATFEKIKLLRNQGRPNSGTFIHPAIGMNFRITDLQGAILSSQLDKLPKIIDQRLQIYAQYLDSFKDLNLKFMRLDERSDYIPFRIAATVNQPMELIKKLEDSMVQGRNFFYPMHRQPALEHYNLANCVNSQALYNTGICLPVHREVTKNDIDTISKVLEKFL